MTEWADVSPRGRAALRALCESSHLVFVRAMFQARRGEPFVVGPHHPVLARVMDDVIAGRRRRVLINVPPGYTKTETSVIALVARGLAINPAARFIHASFSGELVNENSVQARDTVKSEVYQSLWPTPLRDDTDAKGLWRTDRGGGLLAKPAGGPITGFRAGLMTPGFTGALVIDDPLKPDDAFSDVARRGVNSRWHSTFKSRLAREDVPVIVIMQRLHRDDFSGMILRGGTGEVWDHLWLPVVIGEHPYPGEWTHGRPIAHGLPPGPLWPAKHTASQIDVLRHDAYTYAAQYAQLPIAAGGSLIKEAWVHRYDGPPPPLSYRVVTVDTAQKTGTRNDYTVVQVWGAALDGRPILIDTVRGRVETPDLEPLVRSVWARHVCTRAWPTPVHGALRGLYVEDASSGTGLIQSLRRGARIPVLPLQRTRDKFTRCSDVVPYMSSCGIWVPQSAPWVTEYVAELLAFDGLGSGHDDQVDTTMDAFDVIYRGGPPLSQWV